MPAAALPFVLGAAQIGVSLYQSSQQASAQKSASAAANAQMQRQQQLEQEAQSRMANEESEANAAAKRDEAKRRQAGLAIGAGGRQDTILTGPLGLQTDESQSGKKTLLGT